MTIFDETEVNLVSFRRTIYLAIQSRCVHRLSQSVSRSLTHWLTHGVLLVFSLDFEECAHKLIRMEFPDSQTVSSHTHCWVS